MVRPSADWTEKAALVLFWLSISSLAALGVSMDRSPLVWADETMIASGALSLARGGTGIPTFTAFPEQMLPFHWFYGPVYFELSAWAMRVFGASMTVYRSVSFASSVILVLAVALYAWVLSRSRLVVALTVAIVVFMPEFGSGVTNGRMDHLGIGLLLGGVALFLLALEHEKRERAVALTGLAALVFGLAMLTTPRCFPLAMGFGVSGAWVAITRAALRRRLLVQMVFCGGIVFLMIAAWTFSQGFSPLGWLHIIRATTQGDVTNASPVLGGNWNFELVVPTMVSLAALAVAVPAAVFARTRANALRLTGTEAIAIGMTIVNALATFLLISRPFNYLVFWGMPLLLTALAVSGRSWRAIPNDDVRNDAAETVHAWRPAFIIWIGLLIAGGEGALRLAKHLDVAASWRARDPRPVSEFIRHHLPIGSRVFGPYGLFFWAVETNGSQYLSAHGWLFVTRKTLPPDFDPTPILGPPPSAIPLEDALLLWPDDETMPRTLSCGGMTEVAHFQPPDHRSPRAWDRLLRRRAGYPAATLYRMKSCHRPS